MNKIVMGLSAVVAVGALAACSTAAASTTASNHPKIAVAANTAGSSTTQSSVDTTTAAPTTTSAATTTTHSPAKPPAAPPVQPAAPPAPALTPGVPCAPGVNACVNLATRKAWLVENGQVVLGPVSIMPGRPGFRTPTGTFHVLSKVAHYWSHTFNAPMPDAVFFYPGVAFHIGSLSVYSHGCIHLSASSAAMFFKTLSIGDTVQVLHG